MNYAVIAENDVSQWSDATGEIYHFPRKYQKILTPGTKIIYYKGKNKTKTKGRLSNEPHYFGIADICKVFRDQDSDKGDLFAQITNYQKFSEAIPIKENESYYEEVIHENHWRNGVRKISEDIYRRILKIADYSTVEENKQAPYLVNEEIFTPEKEGKKTLITLNKAERNQRLRHKAIALHGTTCKVCGFNFKEFYGDFAEDFIEIHHNKPLSELEQSTLIDPKTDLVPVCPNCHRALHLKKSTPYTVEELKEIINKNSDQ